MQNRTDATISFDDIHLLEDVRNQFHHQLTQPQRAVDLPDLACREADLQLVTQRSLHCSSSSSSSSSASIHQHVSDRILEQGANVHAHDGLHLPVQSRRLFLTNVGEKKHGQLFHEQ